MDTTQAPSAPTPTCPVYYNTVDYLALVWELDTEPDHHDPNQPNQELLHLYTISGHLLIGYWPKDGLIGEHFTAWARLTPAANNYHH